MSITGFDSPRPTGQGISTDYIKQVIQDTSAAQLSTMNTTLSGHTSQLDVNAKRTKLVSVLEYENLKVAVAGGFDWKPVFQQANDVLPADATLIVPYRSDYAFSTPVTLKDGVHIISDKKPYIKALNDMDALFIGNDISNIRIKGLKIDGNGKAKNCVLIKAVTMNIENIIIEKNTVLGTKVDPLLFEACIQVVAAGGASSAFRPKNVRIRKNRMEASGSHGWLAAYCDDVKVHNNIIKNQTNHGGEAVGCTDIETYSNYVVDCTLSGLGVGSHTRGFSIHHNTVKRCGGDGSITVEHNSIHGDVSDNKVYEAKTSGINVSFGTPIAAPFDKLRNIKIKGNFIEGIDTSTREGILVYSDIGANLGDGIELLDNTIEKFSVGIDARYLTKSSINNNKIKNLVGVKIPIKCVASTYSDILNNSWDIANAHAIQLLNYSSAICDRITIDGTHGYCQDANTQSIVYIEGTGWHTIDNIETNGAFHFVQCASTALIKVHGNKGNLASTPFSGGNLDSCYGNSPATQDFNTVSVAAVANIPNNTLYIEGGILKFKNNAGAAKTVTLT